MTDQEFATALAYDALGLKPGASETLVRARRLQLIRTFHPDIYHGDRAAADRKLAKINAAFDDVMADLRARGVAMSAEDRAWEKAARRAAVQRKSAEARKAAQGSAPRRACRQGHRSPGRGGQGTTRRACGGDAGGRSRGPSPGTGRVWHHPQHPARRCENQSGQNGLGPRRSASRLSGLRPGQNR